MKDTRFKVAEIFSSIDGEGLRAGLPVTFIRLHGCNLKCSYCDSQYACVGNDFIDIALEDIIKIDGIKVKFFVYSKQTYS